MYWYGASLDLGAFYLNGQDGFVVGWLRLLSRLFF